MVLELEWLAKHPELDRLVRIDQPVEDISIQQSADNILTSVRTRRELYSGHQVTLTTPNAEKYPLPDKLLIELQWFLARVLRMSGAGEDNDMEHDDSPMASPIASPVASPMASTNVSPIASTDSMTSFRIESPVEHPEESPAASRPNSLPHQPFFNFIKQSSKRRQESSLSVALWLPEAKRLWKSARTIPFRGRQKLGPNTASIRCKRENGQSSSRFRRMARGSR